MCEPLVHVLVINWNGLGHLEACFASLLEIPYKNVRYVLVDNGSTDGSVAYVRDAFGGDARVEILECHGNLGWSGGNNAGIRRALEAGAEYVFLLNNDTATEADALEKLVAFAESNPKLGALAPKMLMYSAPEILNSVGLVCSRIGACWDRGIGRLDGPAWNAHDPVIGVCGGAMFLRTAALGKTGLLPEDFGIYLDDLDLCLRIWGAGYEIRACPEARVRHKFSATLGEGARARHKYYLNTRNRFRVLLRNFPVRTLVHAFPALVLGEAKSLGRAGLDGAFWRISRHAHAWLDSLIYLPKARRARREQRAAGLEPGRFLPLLLREPLFCPGAVFPLEGWYPERTIAGRVFRPMAARAELSVPAGRLRVFHANCYPRLGETRIRVTSGGKELGVLHTLGLDETLFDVSGGRVEFEALSLFSADDTGEVMDLGGWLAVHPET